MTDPLPWLSFALADSFVEPYRTKQPPFGGNGLGEATFYGRYSRPDNPRLAPEGWDWQRDEPHGVMESWADTCRRVVEGMHSIERDWCLTNGINYSEEKAQDSAEAAFDQMFNLRWTPPGRGLWAMGTEFVHGRGHVEALQNCAYATTKELADDPIRPFTWLMDMSMMGVGVGFDTRGAGTVRVRQPDGMPMTYPIPDSREGWVRSTGYVLAGFLRRDHPGVELDYGAIRPKGTPIRGFGGVAGGPESLRELHETIRELLGSRAGELITSTDIVDLMNLIGRCVVAGNVRRSAEIAIGDADDLEFTRLKSAEHYPRRNGRESGEQGWAWLSNNSVRCTPGQDYTELAKLTWENGEPGYIWMDNVNRFARMNRVVEETDAAEGFNPCFTGDTLVWTLHGPRRFDTLVGQEVQVLTEREDGRMVFRRMHNIRQTRSSAPVYKVSVRHNRQGKISEGSFTATGDHRVFMRDRTERMVAELRPGDRLASVYARLNNGRYRILNNGLDHDAEHRIVEAWPSDDRAPYPDWHVDHINEDKLDNRPENLRRLPAAEHNARGMMGDDNPLRRDPELARRLASARDVAGENNPRYRHDIEDDELVRLRDSGMSYAAIAARVGCSKYTVMKRIREVANHVVVAVEYMGEAPVYDGEVDGTHRFYIQTETDGGVLVHNCSEQPLEPWEMCTLAEIYTPNIPDVGEARQVVKHSYRYAKIVTIANRRIEDPRSREVMVRNGRIGLGQTGIAQVYVQRGRDELVHWMEAMYGHVQRYDRLYSQYYGLPQSIRTTTVKPSGTVSTLAGCTPGVHFSVAGRRYLRRVTMPAGARLPMLLAERGYPVEQSLHEDGSWLVGFPVDAGEGMVSERDVSPREQLELVALVARHWADNNPSATIKFDPEEVSAEDLAQLLSEYDTRLKAVSFLPLGNGAYPQMPYEELSEARYNELVSKITPFHLEPGEALGLHHADDRWCEGDTCELAVERARAG